METELADSTATLIGDHLLTAHSATTGGVHSFAQALALELGGSGITVDGGATPV